MLNKKIAKPLSLHLKQQGIAQPRQPLSTLAAVVWKLSGTKDLLFFLFVIFSSNVAAQFNVTIKLSSLPEKRRVDSVYLAGSFNGWNPAHEAYRLSADNSTVLKLNGGSYEFKFTRGGWEKVECTARGVDVANHQVQIESDTTLIFSVAGWKDDFSAAARRHTASPNLSLLAEDFTLTLLNRQRPVWVYLPPGYDNSKKRYPVLYMHDAQNLFDEYNAPFGEWGVDECLDSLIEKGKPACIVVAVENGKMERMSEYNPYEFTWKNGKDSTTFPPRGDDYLNDIINTLKPLVDKKYRTLPSKENTIIAGSSMGGLISYYAAIKYPNTFGKAGVFSPAFWTASGIDSLTDAASNNLKGKYFFYMGGKEGGTYVEDMNRICGKAGKNSTALIYSVIDPEGEHNENTWRKWFPEFYNWIMADGYNANLSPGD